MAETPNDNGYEAFYWIRNATVEATGTTAIDTVLCERVKLV